MYLRLDHSLPPPAGELEHRDPVTGGGRGHGVLPPVLVGDGEDPHHGVAILLDQVVHVPGEHGLADDGDLETFGHLSSKMIVYQARSYPGHTPKTGSKWAPACQEGLGNVLRTGSTSTLNT